VTLSTLPQRGPRRRAPSVQQRDRDTTAMCGSGCMSKRASMILEEEIKLHRFAGISPEESLPKLAAIARKITYSTLRHVAHRHCVPTGIKLSRECAK
jgi:hypothetical protein